MAIYKTPGVYIEEISTLPPSVAAVSTAIPAFIGCTEMGSAAPVNGKVTPVIGRIETMLDFQSKFGGPYIGGFTVETQMVAGVPALKPTPDKPLFGFLLYYQLSMYFKNGGGSCYIVSVGDYKTVPTKDQFSAGLVALEKEDEPTLILLTDAVNLVDVDYYDLCQQALAHCEKMGDRFAILDVLNSSTSDNVAGFRNGIGTNNLTYGAAYYPYLRTSLNYAFDEKLVKISSSQTVFQKVFGDKGIVVKYSGDAADAPRVTILSGAAPVPPATPPPVTFGIIGKTLTINTTSSKTGADVVAAWSTDAIAPSSGFTIIRNDDGSAALSVTTNTALDIVPTITLDAIRSSDTALYNQAKAAIGQLRVVLPPSGAIAGTYAYTDRLRGVWKAPANLSVASVIEPVVKITNDAQDNLNVDVTAGKSINAIRAFTGKGSMVWGARTLAGNDNEWRYVSVRRLFIMIEESTQKASAFAVFEPNDATTWLKVKAMIESFLFGLWEQGALAGSTSDQAYFVNVGLGKTMTAQDILEGRLIVEIGIAAVRPAEFVILRFSHKMQEA